jgi:hypothetical protein
MRYIFKPVDIWEELRAAVGDRPCSVEDSGDEMILDFGNYTLTPTQEVALVKLMAEKPLLRGKLAKLVEKK